MLNVIFPANDLDVVVKNLHTDANPDTPITDATITFTIFDPDNNALTNAEDINMTDGTDGDYRGKPSGAIDLTIGAWYKIVITCSNYRTQWTKKFQAQTRPFTI